MDMTDLMESLGVSPLSEADVLARPNLYGAALVVGYSMLNQNDAEE